jgi:bacillolysin
MKKTLLLLAIASSTFAQAQVKNSKKIPSATAPTTQQDIPLIQIPKLLTPQSDKQQASLLSQWSPLSASKVVLTKNPLRITRDQAGDIIMLEGSKEVMPNPDRSTAQKTLDYLVAIQAELGFRSIETAFQLIDQQQDELGQTHYRMQQVHQNIPVYGGEIMLHERNHKIDLMNGRFYPESNLTNVVAKITQDEAIDIAEKHLVAKDVTLAESDLVKERYKTTLVIYHPKRTKTIEHLAWHLIIKPNAMARYEYFIDAISGELIHHFNHTCNFVGHYCKDQQATSISSEEMMDGSADATAKDLFGISRNLKTYLSQGNYYLIDATRSMFKLAQSKIPNDPIGAIWTLDAFNTSPEKNSFKYDNVTSLDNKWTNKAAAISAHYNAGLAYEYFKNVHQRESINGQGGTIIGLVNVAEKNGGSMENAFWNGEAMFYGNGGSAFFPLARGLDVAGHELSHGVIQNTANLEYEYESGAMNEAFADIFGAMIDRDDWKIGEDVVKTNVFPSGALRDLSNPNNGGKNLNDNGWQPKNMSEKYNGADDNGGVHINSGIPNFAFYKYATAPSMDKAKAEKVFYRALSKYLVKSSQFVDLRAAVQQSANDLYGSNSNESKEVANAFAAVGIGGGGSTSGTTYQQDISINPGSDIVAYTNDQYSNVSFYFPATKQIVKATETDINSRPSVTDDGSYMVFVAADKTIHGLKLNWQTGNIEEEIISGDNIWKNAVISKDGNLIAVSKDAAENVIYVYDFTKNPVAAKAFVLTNPTYTSGIATGEVQYSDAMEFDVSGNYIMYDAYNVLRGTTGNTEYWDIGFLRVYDNKAKKFGDGKIEKLFSDLPEGTSVGNPVFAKNSPYIIAFDYQDELDDKNTYILTANLETGDVGEIYYNGEDRFGFPTFSRLDDRLAFETTDNLGDFIGSITLNADKLSAKTTQPAEVVNEGYFPLWFSNGSRILVSNNEVEKLVFTIFPNPTNDFLYIDCPKFDNIYPYQLIDLTGKIVQKGEINQERQVLQIGHLTQGTYILKIADGAQKIIKM